MRRILLVTLIFLASCSLAEGRKANVKGTVTADGKPLAGVLVSDGDTFVRTDRKGRYSMFSDKADSTVFVISPSGYTADLVDGIRPGFWAALTRGQDECERHDFSFHSEDQSTYTVYFTPDLHLGAIPYRHELERMEKTVLPKLREFCAEDAVSGPVYSMCLGDITQDKFWYHYGYDGGDGYRTMTECGYPTPVYAITGNHDNDGAVFTDNTDFDAAWLYRKCWGPDKYSVNIGDCHWIFMDDIIYVNDIEGNRKAVVNHNYECGFTERQLKWLEKDLSFLPDDARICFCTHIPLVNSFSESGLRIKRKQMDTIYALFSRFKNDVTAYSGHIHHFDFCLCPDYPRYHQYSMPAASGCMWETVDGARFYAEDGGAAGVYSIRFSAGKAPQGSYRTYWEGDTYFRAYDLNSVGGYYRNDPGFAFQKKNIPSAPDYSDECYRNCVLVNYWAIEPGERVEMLECGKVLEVVNRPMVDPLNNITFTIPRSIRTAAKKKKKMKEVEGPRFSNKMFMAKASAPDTPVTIRIYAADGSLRYEQTVERPKSFAPEAE